MPDLRKMTMGEIAEIADIPKETARMRLKSSLGFISPQGWARFDVPSTVRFAVHARTLELFGQPEIALKVADFVGDSLLNLSKIPPFSIRRTGMLKGNFLIFRQAFPPIWSETWLKTEDEALDALGKFTAHSYVGIEGAGFFFVNVGTLTDWALDRVFDLQEIDGNTAQVPQ